MTVWSPSRSRALTLVALIAALLPAPLAAQDEATPTCFGVPATIVGTADDDVLRGTERADVIVGLGGDDRIYGYNGADLICGGDGRDRILGGKRGDRIDGGPGGDRLNGNTGDDVILGGAGNDRILGGAGNDELRGDAGRRDRLFAGPGDADACLDEQQSTLRAECESTAPFPPHDLVPSLDFAERSEVELHTDGAFAIWWDVDADFRADAETMADNLNDTREIALAQLGLTDPPNLAAGEFVNIYIHEPGNDVFPDWWGNGVGTEDGLPYMTLPVGAHIDLSNLRHEGFHIFQYAATAPGYAYSGDTAWYVEASAQWFMADQLGDAPDAFIEAFAIPKNPHLALWHSFDNERPGDPLDWPHQVRQYGMHTWLIYLTQEAGVDRKTITKGYHRAGNRSPQEYLADQVGISTLREHFADFAARSTGGFDYLTVEQVDRAAVEWELVGAEGQSNPFVLSVSSGDEVDQFRPAARLIPRGWAYNAVEIDVAGASSSTIAFRSDEGDGVFALRWVIVKDDAIDVEPIDIAVGGSATATVALPVDATEAYLIIASAPDAWAGSDGYGYELDIAVD